MWNKVLVGLGMATVVGLMVAGVAYAVAGGESGTGGNAEGGRRWSEAEASGMGRRLSVDAARGTSGQGGGRWGASQAAGLAGRQPGEANGINEPLAALAGLETVRGVVESIDASELELRTDAGELVEIALGQSAYWETHGLPLTAGDVLVVEGYREEDGTFAASTVMLVATSETVVLRDESGRPMWSGGRRNAGAGSAPAL